MKLTREEIAAIAFAVYQSSCRDDRQHYQYLVLTALDTPPDQHAAIWELAQEAIAERKEKP